jgi:hypothetical protein
MFCHGRLVLYFAVFMGAITSGVCIAGDGRRSLVHQQSQVVIGSTERTIASKRTRNVVITITNADGRLRGGDNEFCVLVQKRETRESLDVQNVSVDFTLLVGRIQEVPIKAQLAQDQPGRYCGHVNLGKQYYVPASYYAFVLYTDAGGKKRKVRLFLSVK